MQTQRWKSTKLAIGVQLEWRNPSLGLWQDTHRRGGGGGEKRHMWGFNLALFLQVDDNYGYFLTLYLGKEYFHLMSF